MQSCYAKQKCTREKLVYFSWHIERDKNGSRHFQTHFLAWELFHFDANFTGICSEGSNQLKACQTLIGTDKGLAPIRQQVTIWTKYGIVSWRIYASLGIELTKALLQFYFQLILEEVAAIEALTGVGILCLSATTIYLLNRLLYNR